MSKPKDYSPLPPPVDPMPSHIAIIMDGNGRWARQRGLWRLKGHERGAESLRRVTRYGARIGLSEITFYALSTENYLRRPKSEVNYLMKLLKDYLVGERQELADGNIRLRAIGRTWDLPDDVQRELEISVSGSAGHTGMTLRLALNYGGRREIIDGVRELLSKACAGEADPAILDGDGETAFRSYLYDPEMSDPDLVVRTAGEVRLSNFLLWQASYAEIWVTDVLWPEFEIDHLEESLRHFATRRRKFGAIEPADPRGGPADAPTAGPASCTPRA